MPDFSYVARDNSGNKVSGTIGAASRNEALATLGKQALFPLEVDAATSAARGRQRRIKAQLVATTYAQLADLMRSGVPLLRSLQVLKQQTSHAGLREVLEQVSEQIEEGSTLAEAMARHPRAFGPMAISMVRAGGEGGFLEDALSRVAQFTEQQEDLKGRTLGALAYPVFLAVVGTIVVTVLIVFFVPKFEDLFANLRERNELPVVTEWLLWISHTLGAYGFYILVALILGGWYLQRRLVTEEGQLMRDRVKLRLPLVGKVFLNLAVARFCRVLGTLLHNGVPILRSLEISSSAAGNRVLADAINAAAENISAGESLAQPLAKCGQFPPMVIEMIAVAEESNNLETVLTELADSLDRRTWRQLDLGVRLIEPLMLLILAGVVLAVVVALVLPMMKMSMTI